MKLDYISPWESTRGFKVTAPDGTHVALFSYLIEVAMGAPTGSSLEIDGVVIEGHFSPSCIWSEDSRFLAIPKWIWGGPHHRHQNFSIYCLSTQILHITDQRYSVLQLESFNSGIVKGTHMPNFKDQPFEFDITQFRLK